MRISKSIIIFLVIINNSFAFNEEYTEVRSVMRFPSEKLMIEYDYVIGRSTRFDVQDNIIYLCAQRQNVVYKIGIGGKLIKRIGKRGQGPGEMMLPLIPYINNNELYITDVGNSRINIYDTEGKYIRQIRTIGGYEAFVIIDNKIFVLDLMENTNPPRVYTIYDIEGKKIKDISSQYNKTYNNYYYNNAQTLRIFNNQIHCLQQYGTKYRIMDSNGEIIKEMELEVNPLNINEYKKIGWKYAFQTFTVDETGIYAACAWRGKTIIYVFDQNGRYLKKYSIKQNTDDVYDVSDMKIVNYNGKKYLLLLVFYPDAEFVMFEI